MSQQTQGPVKEFKAGSVKAAIWKDEREDSDHTVVRHSVKIQKRFLDKTSGEWRMSHSE